MISIERIGELKLLPEVERIYVGKKSEVTELVEAHVFQNGGYAYRTPLVCACKDKPNIRQSGAVLIDKDGKVCNYVIRCKDCGKGGAL